MSVKLRNNYYPLHFHDVHGENIKLSENKTVAFRAEGFCNGIVFSDRPVTISEPVYVKFLETSPIWSGALRIGFTMNDPVSLKSKLPQYACPDLTSVRGNWAIAIGEKYAKKDSILYYYVDQSGDVHYGIGSEEYGVIFGGVNTSGKLWAVLDIYGNTVAVEFLDPAIQNFRKLKLPILQPAFMVDGKKEIEIMQHCYANRGISFEGSGCEKKFWLNLPRNMYVPQGAAVQEHRPTKFQVLCDVASAARKVLKEQEAKEMQKKKDSVRNFEV